MNKNKKKLSNEYFPGFIECKTNDELFKYRDTKERAKDDPVYVRLGSDPKANEHVVKHIEMAKPHLDTKFNSELTKSAFSQTWETVMQNYFTSLQFERAPQANNGPDIVITDPENFYIECRATNRYFDSNLSYIPEVAHADKRIAMTKAIEDKLKKQRKYLKAGVTDPSVPYLVAINTASLNDFSYFVSEIPSILSVLVGYDGGDINDLARRREYLNSTKIVKGAVRDFRKPMNLFRDQQAKEISGVIFSDRFILDQDDNDFSNLFYINNPFASVPFDHSLLSGIGTCILDTKGNCVISKAC